MKNLVLSILSLMLALGVFAQDSVDPEVQKAADEMVKTYDLDETQAATAIEIQERRFRNLAEIESLKNTNRDMYRHKFKAIQSSTDASLRRILNEEQMSIYNQLKQELRKKNADKTAQLKAQGLSVDEIEDALLGIDN